MADKPKLNPQIQEAAVQGMYGDQVPLLDEIFNVHYSDENTGLTTDGYINPSEAQKRGMVLTEVKEKGIHFKGWILPADLRMLLQQIQDNPPNLIGPLG